jgi:proline-specific peptidase
MERYALARGGRRIWCGVVGAAQAGRAPLVCVAGGPGAPHDYLESLAPLARDRQVVFYDPLGSGRSDRPTGFAWTQAEYVSEIATVCLYLGVERYHLFAHSAAVLAALPHALARPAGLRSLVLAGTPVDFTAYTAHVEDLLVELGVGRDELAGFETPAAGALSARNARIFGEFMGRYMCRIRPIPAVLMDMGRRYNGAAYTALKGGRLLYTTALRGWDVSARLGEVDVPVLFTCGGHDMLPLAMCTAVARAFPRGNLAVFADSGHVPHIDEAAAYVARVGEFLHRCDDAEAG